MEGPQFRWSSARSADYDAGTGFESTRSERPMKSSIRFATAVLLFGLLPFPGNAQDGPAHLWGSLRDVPGNLSPAFVDYDRNGIDDLVGRNNPWIVWVDGWTGEVTKAIRPQADVNNWAGS